MSNWVYFLEIKVICWCLELFESYLFIFIIFYYYISRKCKIALETTHMGQIYLVSTIG
jgi:hypothetical protein